MREGWRTVSQGLPRPAAKRIRHVIQFTSRNPKRRKSPSQLSSSGYTPVLTRSKLVGRTEQTPLHSPHRRRSDETNLRSRHRHERSLDGFERPHHIRSGDRLWDNLMPAELHVASLAADDAVPQHRAEGGQPCETERPCCCRDRDPDARTFHVRGHTLAPSRALPPRQDRACWRTLSYKARS